MTAHAVAVEAAAGAPGERPLDPFGFWPHWRSAIRGLGGSGPADRPHYAFCTPYVVPAPGEVHFTVALSGVSARNGTLDVTLLSLFESDPRPRRRTVLRIPLAKLVDGAGRWRVRVRANRGFSYQLVGTVSPDTDAAATGLTVTLDRWGDGRRFADRLARAKPRVFGRASRVGRRWWQLRSPVAAQGLVVDRRATLAEPLSQMCTAAQFDEPDFRRWLERLGTAPTKHRKLWEIVYILRALEFHGALRPGARGLAFGIGGEATPALLAGLGCEIVASDLPTEAEDASLWAATGQHSDGLERLFMPALCSREAFDRLVRFRPADMTAIPADLRDFDFCWSACAFEHLGSIEAGLRFFRESLRCLKPGGVAVHTTELNLSSNGATVDHAATVLFRRRDMERLALELSREGHEVVPITFDQGDTPLDAHVDVPPYGDQVHLRMALMQYVTTSFGLIVRRGNG